MKNTKGIVCTVNEYVISGVAMVDGRPVTFEDATTVRNAREDKARIAKSLGCKPSAVILDYTLNKRRFIIDSNDADSVIALLMRNGFYVDECTDSNTDSE